MFLEPGGYIQWEDADLVHQVIKGDTAHELEQRLNEIFKRIGLDFKYAYKNIILKAPC
jgi:hypothetical protein